MENAPAIILFAYFGAAILVLTIAMAIAAVILLRKGKGQNAATMLTLGRICSALSILCAVPVVLTVGYILYIRFA